MDRSPLKVIHIAVDPGDSGSGAGRQRAAETNARRLGYEVLPRPNDGQDHPWNRYCPACSEAPDTYARPHDMS